MPITMLDQLPGRERRNHSTYIEAARANPGKWVALPWRDDKSGNIVGHYRKFYPDLDAATRAGITYIRKPGK
jgi:hypothetical protein